MASVSAGNIVTLSSWGVNTEPAKSALFQTQITHLMYFTSKGVCLLVLLYHRALLGFVILGITALKKSGIACNKTAVLCHVTE